MLVSKIGETKWELSLLSLCISSGRASRTGTKGPELLKLLAQNIYYEIL